MDVLFARVLVRRKGRAVSRRGIKSIFLAGLLLALGVASFTASAAISMAQLSTEQRLQTEAMLTQQIQRLVDVQRRVEGQGKFVKVQVRLDQSRGFVLIDLSPNYLPSQIGPHFDDLADELADEAVFLLRDSITVHGVLFTYGGKDIYDYFPEDKPESPPSKSASSLGSRGDLVVISAGHGKYINFGRLGRNPTWKWQRPTEWNGIIEDVNTPHFADELGRWFYQRSFEDVITSPARSTSTAIHTPSGEEWWKVAGKYHLQSILPDNSEIWNYKNYGSLPLADYNNDINSRPQYANYLDATAVIHLHSDAAETNPNVRGTNALYHEGREQDRLLANSILCSMKEIIQAQEAYTNYQVNTDALARTNKGENTLAQMPSVLIEVGFHTNPTDAAAMLDPAFRTASMKGVEKGYRRYREGIPCEVFAIASIPSASGPQNEPIQHIVNYKGFPQFPVKAMMEFVTCQDGWICNDFQATFGESVPSPLIYTTTCRVSTPRPPGTFVLRTTLVDADGVSTDPVDHTYTCTTPAGQIASDIAPTGEASANVGPG